MILFPSGTSPPLSRVSRCPWKAAQYMWSGEAMVPRCHTFKNQILNILTLKGLRLRFFFADSKILLSINKVSFTVNFIPIFLHTNRQYCWCLVHLAQPLLTSYHSWRYSQQLLLVWIFSTLASVWLPQGPLFINFYNNDSSRASAPAPSPWLDGILRAMATPDRRPETLTTSSSEQIFLVWV